MCLPLVTEEVIFTPGLSGCAHQIVRNAVDGVSFHPLHALDLRCVDLGAVRESLMPVDFSSEKHIAGYFQLIIVHVFPEIGKNAKVAYALFHTVLTVHEHFPVFQHLLIVHHIHSFRTPSFSPFQPLKYKVVY